jgi:hypothetical protein
MKKIKGDEPNEVQYIYTWQYHKEILCIITFISKKQKCHVFLFNFSFFLLQNWRTGEQSRSSKGQGCVWYQWEGRDGGRESSRRVNMSKCCVHMYVNGKIYLLKLFQEWGEGR